jgi:F-box protein 21
MTAATDMTSRQRLSTWSDLPDEVLQHILFYLSPDDLLSNVQRVSKRFSRLAREPLLWRHHCRVHFRYWDSKHRIRQKFLGNVGDVDWKTLYMHRKRVESETASVLDSIIEGQVNRIQKFKLIADFGYDAKDTLLKHCRTCETAEDVLARRQAVYSRLHWIIQSNRLPDTMPMLS